MARLEGDLHALRGIARKGRELVSKVVVDTATITQPHQFLHGPVRLGDIDFGLERRGNRNLLVSRTSVAISLPSLVTEVRERGLLSTRALSNLLGPGHRTGSEDANSGYALACLATLEQVP